MFHLVSLSLQISLTDLPGPCLGLCVGVACFVVLGGFVGGFFLWGKFDLNHMLIPVVDRPCLALVRQCRGKKKIPLERQLYPICFEGACYHTDVATPNTNTTQTNTTRKTSKQMSCISKKLRTTKIEDSRSLPVLR